MKYCAECTKPDERPIRYTLGKCDRCGTYLGVAEVEFRPQIVDELFGHLGKPPKKDE